MSKTCYLIESNLSVGTTKANFGFYFQKKSRNQRIIQTSRLILNRLLWGVLWFRRCWVSFHSESNQTLQLEVPHKNGVQVLSSPSRAWYSLVCPYLPQARFGAGSVQIWFGGPSPTSSDSVMPHSHRYLHPHVLKAPLWCATMHPSSISGAWKWFLLPAQGDNPVFCSGGNLMA